MPHPSDSSYRQELFLALAEERSDEAFFALVARSVLRATGAETAVVTLLDESRATLTFAGVAGPHEGELRGTRVAVGHARLGPAALSGVSQTSPRELVEPILLGGLSLGALAAQDKSADFSEGDARELKTLAAAAATRVAAIRRRRETAAALRRLTAAEQALDTVLSAATLPESLDALCNVAREHLDADAVALFLADEDGRALHLAADVGLPDALRERSLDSLEVAEAWAEPSGLVIREAIPLRRGEKLLGVLLALGRAPMPDSIRREVARTLGRQASLAIECASLREEVARRADEATTLYELSQAVTATLKTPEVLARAAEAARNRLAVEKVAIFLREPGSERLRLAHAAGLFEGAEARLKPLVGQGLPGWVVRFETPTASSDLKADRRDESYTLAGEGVASLVAAPLQSGNQTIGVLCGLTARPRWFTVAEIELAYTIANQTAVALENARAYALARRQSVALRRYLQGVARAVSSPRSHAQVPDVITALTRDALGADRAALYRVRSEGDGAVALDALAASGHRAGEPWLLPTGGDSPAAWVARKGRAICVPSAAEDARFGTLWEKPKSGAYVAVPLKTEDGTIGVLEIWRKLPSEDRGSDLRQLSALAKHAALALEGTLRRRKR